MDGPSLLILPLELLQAVYTQFCAHCRLRSKSGNTLQELPLPVRDSDDTKTLINLSQTCRALRELVTPCIYHDFVSRRGRGETTRNFIFALCENPGSAASVRRLVMYDALYKIGDEWLVSQRAIQHGLSIPADLDRLLNEAEAPGPFPHNLDLYCYAVGMLYDLLLSRVVNLEYLNLVICDEVDYGNFFPPETTWPVLKTLQLEFEEYNRDDFIDTPGSYDLKQLQHLFGRLPSLQNLEIAYCCTVSIDIDLGSLKWLKLRDSYLEMSDLARLVKHCSQLETFIFHTSVNFSVWTAVTEGYIPANIPKILSAQKDTLHHLEVQCNWDVPQHDPEVFITSLKQFTALETVILDIACLADIEPESEYDTESEDGGHGEVTASTSEHGGSGGSAAVGRDVSLVELLPESIETFVLDGYHPGFYRPISELLRQPGRSHLPRLRKFKLVHTNKFNEPDGSENLAHDMGDSDVLVEVSNETTFCPL